MTRAKKVLAYTFLTIASILSVFPLYWMIVSGTNKSIDVIAGKLIPGKHLLENWSNLLASHNVKDAFINSFKYSTVQTIVSLIICSIAGYGFEVFHDRKKDRLFSVLLLTMMVPFVTIMIPLFQMFSKIDLLNTTLGFILPNISTPFLIMLFRQSARSFPPDIIDASRIDGLSEVEIFLRMFIPTMRSTYATGAIVTFMNAWNNYLWPKVIMTDSSSMTMPMLVANITGGYVTDYGMLMLAVVISTLPTIIIFFVLQKSFVDGFAGTVK